MMLNPYDFNEAQWEALVSPIDIDVLVSAGAGSGKTFVLSQKVYRHIVNGDIKPSELLVLTFTNNAAYEMKERIINSFGGLRLKGLPNLIDATLILSSSINATFKIVLEKSKTKSYKLKRLEEGKASNTLIGTWKGEDFTICIEPNGKGRLEKNGQVYFFNYEDKDDPRFKKEILSAHINTFDSFNQYILSLYSDSLGYPHTISVAPDCIMESKKKKILEALLKEDYLNPLKKDILKKAIELYSFNGDEELSNHIIEGIYPKISGLTKSKKEEFFSTFKERYYSKDSFNRTLNELCKVAVDFINSYICQAYTIFYGNYRGSKYSVFNPPKASDFLDSEPLVEIVHALEECISKRDPFAFFFSLNELKKTMPKFFGGKFVDKTLVEYNLPFDILSKIKASIKEIRKIAWASCDDDFLKNTLLYFNEELTFERAYTDYLRSKESVCYLIELTRRLDERMSEEKKMTGSLTFTDIKLAVLELLTDSTYVKEAEEIRSRFKFIMIDEYQDTEPAQEAFIDAMLKVKKDGTRSHLFAVGDAKQSIYAFRNSDVTLFNKRKEAFSDGNPAHKVIAMNINYRSGEPLLKDINRIFTSYMSIDEGGIDYTLESEQLHYPKEGASFNKEYDGFGIKRITSCTGVSDDMGLLDESPNNSSSYMTEWEVDAIAQDIKNKVASKYLVYDPKEGIRPCRYEDFAIIVRKGTYCFETFSSIFARYEIPLNFKITSQLKTSEPIKLISSLLGLVGDALDIYKADIPHLFASVARSYAFCYDDKKLEEILLTRDENKRPSVEKIKKEPLMQDIKVFANNNANITLSKMFLNLVSSFPVIKELVRLGDVSKYTQHIDELYRILQAHEAAGEGLKEFLSFLKNINRYNISLESEETVSISGAVDLMTIHGSKGLGRLIVYLPNSLNMVGKTHGSEYEETFDLDLGYVAPFYRLPSNEDPSPSALTIPYLAFRGRKSLDKEAEKERARLYYVAFTRAQNQVILVGDPYYGTKDFSFTKDIKNETLYSLYASFGVYGLTDEALNLFKKHLDKTNFISIKEVEAYQKAVDEICSFIKTSNESENAKKAEKVEDANAYIQEFLNKVLYLYLHEFAKEIENKDTFARIFAFSYYQYLIDTEKELLERSSKKRESESIFEQEEDDEEEVSNTKENTKKDLDKLDKLYLFSLEASQSYERYSHAILNDKLNREYLTLLRGCFYVFEGLKKSVIPLFNSDIYQEKSDIFHLSLFAEEENRTIKIPQYVIDDTPIVFSKRVKARASKMSSFREDDNPVKEALNFGTKLHSYFENIDWDLPDASFIVDEKERRIVERVLELPLLKELSGAKFYPEYQYYDPDLDSTGSIDLLVVKDNKFTIIDWKTKAIDDEAYVEQLHVYSHNVARLFSIDAKNIDLYLISILEGKVKKIG